MQSEIVIDIKKNMVEYETSIEKKTVLIHELDQLDLGFENLYKRIQDEIINNVDFHKDKIKEMQRLISVITDRSIEIQQKEERNRQIISQQFAILKKEVKNFKDNRNIVNSYYNSMQNKDCVPPHFLDKKK